MTPEKTAVFGPLVIFFLFFLFIIIIFLTIVIKLVLRGRSSAWTGVLVDKKFAVGQDSDDNPVNCYTLIFKTNLDKQVKVAVTKNIYDDYNIGDKAEKISGKFHINKI